MYKSTKKLSKSKKEKILQESYEPGCVISELANQHGISPRAIYSWRTKDRAKSEMVQTKKPMSNFVELSVTPPVKHKASLKRAVLEFNNLSVSIDGDIKSSTLLAMLNILGDLC